MDDDLKGLRRVGLGGALVLLTWAFALTTLEPGARVAPFGLPLVINRPALIPLALAIGTLYVACKYLFQAAMVGESSYRRRRNSLDAMCATGTYTAGESAVYWGPREFESATWSNRREEADLICGQIASVFPQVIGARVQARVLIEHVTDQDGEVYPTFAVHFTVPRRSRLAACFADLDYFLPFWFPVLAVALYAGRVLVTR